MQKPIDLKSKLDRISAVAPVLKAINGIIKLSPNNPQHREWFEEDNKKEITNMENIKEIIKKDIFNILDKLVEIRINEVPNFKLYKNMSICFSDSFENYRTMEKQDDDFIKQLTNKLTSEIKSLHEIIETNTDDYELFKSLNDLFIKLTKILYIINKVKQSKNYEDNKEYIFLLRSGDWQKVICKDIDITMNTEKDKLESISFIPCNESCEEDIIPLFLNINEVVGIFPSRKNKKDKTKESFMKEENNLLKEK